MSRRVQVVNTTNIDEARRIFNATYADSRVEPDRAGSFRWTMDLLPCGPVKLTVGLVSGSLEIIAPGQEERPYVVMLSGGEQSELTCAGERRLIARHRSGAVLSPDQRIKLRLEDGFQGRNLIIERGALEAHLTALTGHTPRALITFDTGVDLEAGPGATLYRIAQLLGHEMEQPGASPHVMAALRDALLTSLLTCVKHSASRLLEPQPPRIGPGYVKRAEEYIEAHVTEPLTLTQIAAVAGVPARSLRAAFTARHGVAPMQFLRQRRFELARQRLLEAPPGTTVLGVVRALGLGDPGRFSVEYKRRFGESPSDALAGGRARGYGPIIDHGR